MKIKVLISTLFLAAALAGYFFWSLKDRYLKMVPDGIDALVLIDVKQAKEQYAWSWLTHPSQWLRKSEQRISLDDAGITIPDFIQIFHLKNTSFAHWYAFFEIKDQSALKRFLKQNGFKPDRKSLYKRNEISIHVLDSKCIMGLSNGAFSKDCNFILKSKSKVLYANNLINNSVASLSYFGRGKTYRFGINLNADNVEIKSKTVLDLSPEKIAALQKVSFLQFHLDDKNVKIAEELLNRKLPDSLQISALSGVSTLQKVNDKVVTYSYDENFNEVENVSYQKLVRPNYQITFASFKCQALFTYLRNQSLINRENQFTVIPFQPNIAEVRGNQLNIRSTGAAVSFTQTLPGSYVFIRNSPDLEALVSSFSPSGAAAIRNLEYLYYRDAAEFYTLKIKFKHNDLPLILR